MAKPKTFFFVEVTDTFGGEANYAWVRRFKVKANTLQGAVGKVSKEMGYSFRKDYDAGDMVRYNASKACVCLFISEMSDEENKYNMVEI